MTVIFIAGSRCIAKLGHAVSARLDNIIEKGFKVIIGDANGADKAVQQYLNDKGHDDVRVYHMNNFCRNNVGNWPAQSIEYWTTNRKDFAYFSTKDKAMAKEADYGLMIWDGVSRGTVRNIFDLLSQNKPVAIYFSLEDSFQTVRTLEQFQELADSRGLGDFSKLGFVIETRKGAGPA